MMKRACLYCNEKIIGRTDKKFCSDGCRNTYNNEKNKEQSILIRKTNNLLRKNYRILTSFNKEDQQYTTTKVVLLEMGFRFKLYTHSYISTKGFVFYCVYNMGYVILDNQAVVILNNTDYL